MSHSPASPARVLIVDDDSDIRNLLAQIVEIEGFMPLRAATGEEALDLIRQSIPSVVLLDVNMPGMDGIQVLREARKIDAHTPIILVTANGSVGSAVEAVKNGAYDYVTKPFDYDELILTVRRGLESRRLKQENHRLRSQMDNHMSLREVMGASDQIGQVFGNVERVAPTDFAVILSGEPGTGKELVARAIHRLSKRARASFVTVDCASIQANQIETELFGQERGTDRPHTGKFKLASGGTLYLDEVQNLPPSVQTRFVRALQELQINQLAGARRQDNDVRIVAGTSQELNTLVAQGRFREDLFHRLNEFTIAIPALRQRKDDIIFLAKRFLDLTREELNKDVVGIMPLALEQLLDHRWPGNVRELRNVIRRAVLLADGCIGPEHLGLGYQASSAKGKDSRTGIDLTKLDGKLSFKELVRKNVMEVEREILTQALKQTGGNKAEAARILRIDYKTIHTKTKEYGLGKGGECSETAEGIR